jgi:AraC family transcriptional regulator
MHQLEILTQAIAYIENHLSEAIKTEDVAAACFCSKTTLEKLFRTQKNCSVHSYIIRRRMTLAGQELRQHPERRIIDIALDFGYTSNEAFTRAFCQVWNCTPSDFRKLENPAMEPSIESDEGETDSIEKAGDMPGR